MTILAVYYALADIVLLGQCLYYRGFTLSDSSISSGTAQRNDNDNKENDGAQPTERSALLSDSTTTATTRTNNNNNKGIGNDYASSSEHRQRQPSSSSTGWDRRPSVSSFRERFASVDGTHLSPATPFIESLPAAGTAAKSPRCLSTLQAFLFNAVAITLVCTAGVLGWYVSVCTTNHTEQKQPKPAPAGETLSFNVLGQVFGYLCAAFYLGSRVPQLLLNFRRKSTDGLSLLFFLFACVGNLTYVLSIFAYSPRCAIIGRERSCRPGEAVRIYGRYILMNLSWLLGSLGTLLLDMAIFVQFFLYRKSNDDEDESGA
jgi:solute carrier family 66 (lysosomal lysine-arginine transporter), member 1